MWIMNTLYITRYALYECLVGINLKRMQNNRQKIIVCIGNQNIVLCKYKIFMIKHILLSL